MHIQEQLLTKACEDLWLGKCVVLPTETVYGLAADATNDQAVAQIFAIKGRPTFNPLIIHVHSVETARLLVQFNQKAELLAAHFWPGPLTLVLPRKTGSSISYLASAGLDTIAIRIPAHPVALALLEQVATPLAAPSANRSNTLSPTSASDVALSLGLYPNNLDFSGAERPRKALGCSDVTKTPLIIDAGPCAVGIESTIIDLSGEVPLILRPGGIEVERLAPLIGPVQQASSGHSIKAPGMMQRHYAPQTPLRLNAVDKQPCEVLLGFGASAAAHLSDINLSPTGDLTEAAANLFRNLRELDAMHAQRIAVMPIPMLGLGVAINDRLERASQPAC